MGYVVRLPEQSHQSIQNSPHNLVPCLLQEAAKDREHVHLEGKKHMLELLQGIDGAFRPGVLTSLMVRPASHAFLQLLARAQ